jgi:hypothetical protein
MAAKFQRNLLRPSSGKRKSQVGKSGTCYKEERTGAVNTVMETMGPVNGCLVSHELRKKITVNREIIERETYESRRKGWEVGVQGRKERT